MEPIRVSGVILEKTSKKGSPYIVLEVPLTDTYKASFWPQKAEVELLKMYLKEQEKKIKKD